MRGKSYGNNTNKHKQVFQGGETKVMKKSLLALLIFALVFTLAVPAFAADQRFEDVEGDALVNATERLKALGILDGYPDGTFRPNETINRAEFAKIAVALLGFGDIAEQTRGATAFSDVTADHWASGYINIATNQGLFTGYPDGTFKPNNPVTQAEVLAVLIRVLGYNDTVMGSWPTNYITKAHELGITKNVVIRHGNDASDRGTSALLADNALDIEKWGLVETNSRGEKVYGILDGKTIINDNLEVSVYPNTEVGEGSLITSTPSLFDHKDDDTVSAEVYTTDGVRTATFTLAKDYSLDSSYLGKFAKLYVKDNRLFYIQDVTDENDVVSGVVEDVDAGKGTITVDGTKYYFADINYLYYNNEFVGDATDSTEIDAGQDVVLTLDHRGDVVAAYVEDYNLAIATTVDTRNNRLFIAGDFTGLSSNIDMDDLEEVLIIKDGEDATFEDLEEDDIIQLYANEDGDRYKIVATNDYLTGEFEYSVPSRQSTDLSKVTITLDDVDYKVNPKLIDENGELIEDADALTPYTGGEVTLALDKDGKVAAIIEGVASTPANYAVVDYADNAHGRIRAAVNLFTADGDEMYEFANSVKVNGNTWDGRRSGDNFAGTLNFGDLVSYKLNGDDQITSIEVLAHEQADIEVTTKNRLLNLEDGSVTNALLTTSTVIIQSNGEPVSLSEFLASGFGDTDGERATVYVNDKNRVMLMYLSDTIGTTEDYAYVLRTFGSGGNDYVKLLEADGDVVNARGSEDIIADVYAGAVVYYELSGSDLDDIQVRNPDFGPEGSSVYVTGLNEDNELFSVYYILDGERVDVDATIIVSDDTIFYDESGDDVEVVDFDRLVNNNEVSVYVDENNVALVVVIHK